MCNYEILKNLVKFNTIKDKDNVSIINYIEEYLQKYGFITEKKSKYLIMKIGNEPKIGFLGHTDTVEYIDGWNSNPFELTKKDTKLYGLGTCDMKSGIAAFLEAISEINFNKLKYGVKAYFTYDEEIGFSGIHELVNNGEKFPQIMIFGEATNNEILVGSKGLLECKLTFNGIKTHSSTPQKGKSANMNSIKFLYELNNFYETEVKIDKINEFEIPYTTMNIGLINGGSAINSVSAKCEVCVDFRIADTKHINLIKNKIENLAIQYNYFFRKDRANDKNTSCCMGKKH